MVYVKGLETYRCRVVEVESIALKRSRHTPGDLLNLFVKDCEDDLQAAGRLEEILRALRDPAQAGEDAERDKNVLDQLVRPKYLKYNSWHGLLHGRDGCPKILPLDLHRSHVNPFVIALNGGV